jgi:hypothetical protein
MERFARATAVAAALAAASAFAPARAADASLAASIGDAGSEVVFRALSLLGVNYRWGGNSPETGLDCSGLVRLVYADALGLPLPRRSEEISRVGPAIATAELQPGDLVFFNTLRRAFSHVGIYIGNNQFVHAPSTGGSIRVESLDAQYWSRRFDGARRLLTQDLLAAASMNPLSSSAARAMQVSAQRGARVAPAAATPASGPVAMPASTTTLAGLGATTPAMVWVATDGVPAGYAAPSPPAVAIAPPAATTVTPQGATVLPLAATGPLAAVERRTSAPPASTAAAPSVPPTVASPSPAPTATIARAPAARGAEPRIVRAPATASRPTVGARTASRPPKTAAAPARAKASTRADAKGADRRLAARADGLFVN